MRSASTDLFGLTHTNVLIDGLNARWIIPQNAAPSKIILFAKVSDVLTNNPKASDTYFTFTVLNSGFPALVVDYNFTLKERFSDALDNFRSAYDWLIEKGHEPNNILLACDSPGGCLTVGLQAILEGEGKDSPGGCLKLYPEENEPRLGYRAASYIDVGFHFLEINNLRHKR